MTKAVAAAALLICLPLSQTLSADLQDLPWFDWDKATGDWAGVRPTFADHGVNFFGSYSAEAWGDVSGGMKQGSVYTGALQFGVNLDLEKLVGWKGASVNMTWLWLSGRDASADLAGNFLTISNIAGFNTLRMFDLWFQQNLWDDKISIRLGQLNADGDFAISDYGGLFINGTFGWPAALYMNLPNGGPGYPMGTLGARLAVKPVKWLTLLTGIFQGDVFAQNVNRHGFRWRLDSDVGYLWMNEAQVRWNHQDNAIGLPGQAKVGFWYDTANFASVAPNSVKNYQGNYGFYAIVDQMLYREPSPTEPASKDGKAVADAKALAAPAGQSSTQGLDWFGRIGFSPQDRNFLGFYVDTGLSYQGLIPTRDNDTIGLAFAYAQLTDGAAQSAFDDGSRQVGAEMVVEATYQAQLTQWLVFQPDLQFIIHPGGSGSIDNALIIGGRLTVTF
jgi:porin